jgi:hypothetical protein
MSFEPFDGQLISLNKEFFRDFFIYLHLELKTVL